MRFHSILLNVYWAFYGQFGATTSRKPRKCHGQQIPPPYTKQATGSDQIKIIYPNILHSETLFNSKKVILIKIMIKPLILVVDEGYLKLLGLTV